MKKQVAALAADLREHLSYLSELGAEHVELPAAEARTDATASRPSPVAAGARDAAPSPAEHPSARAMKESHNPVETALFADMQPSDTPSISIPGEETMTHSDASLEDVQKAIGDCRRCELCEGRTNIVHTFGNPSAKLMFVGEAPGADEDAQARPFVGRAGQLLTKIIEAIGMRRDDVLIGNINRCRPPDNRPPTPDEAAACRPFILREIDVVKPKVVVLLGNTAMNNLLGTKGGITKAHGIFQDYRGIKVMPTYHPAYLLRYPSMKRDTWEDMKKVRDYLEKES